jgi:hypothetical protein
MNLLQQFPYVARRERRKKVDHGPDNRSFAKQLLWNFLLIAFVAAGCFLGISLTLYYSVNGVGDDYGG